jgi:hypothetical protein
MAWQKMYNWRSGEATSWSCQGNVLRCLMGDGAGVRESPETHASGRALRWTCPTGAVAETWCCHKGRPGPREARGAVTNKMQDGARTTQ